MNNYGKIQDLYLKLIHNPTIPKVYREIMDYYKNTDKESAEVFSYVLRKKFPDNSHLGEQ
jgi:hypothetical protein